MAQFLGILAQLRRMVLHGANGWQMRTTLSLLCPRKRTITQRKAGVLCVTKTPTTNAPFRPMRKRRRGFPSETKVKRGVRVVHRDKLLEEKLGRNDLCPC